MAPNDHCLYRRIAAEEGWSVAPNDYCLYNYVAAKSSKVLPGPHEPQMIHTPKRFILTLAPAGDPRMIHLLVGPSYPDKTRGFMRFIY